MLLEVLNITYNRANMGQISYRSQVSGGLNNMKNGERNMHDSINMNMAAHMYAKVI